jgi:hypothetical protein
VVQIRFALFPSASDYYAWWFPGFTFCEIQGNLSDPDLLQINLFCASAFLAYTHLKAICCVSIASTKRQAVVTSAYLLFYQLAAISTAAAEMYLFAGALFT